MRTRQQLIQMFMLAYNRCEYTDMTLQSLYAVDSGVPWECVHFTVINQASTDATAAVLVRYPQIDKVVILPENLGVAGGMDYYRRNCLDTLIPFVAKIDNDSVFTRGWLRKLLAAMSAHKELAIVGAAQSPGRRAGELHVHDGAGYYKARFVGGRFLARTAVFRRKPIRQGGKKISGWTMHQQRLGVEIGWCHPPAVIEHVGDWKFRHPKAIKSEAYRRYMKEIGR